MELRLARQRESIARNVDGTNMDDRMLGKPVMIHPIMALGCFMWLLTRCLLVAHCTEIYDMAGLSLRQVHRRGLQMLSASIGLGMT